MSKEAMKLAKAWFERNTYGDEAVDVYEALCAALAEQPAQQEPYGYVYEVFCLPECAIESEWVETFTQYEPDSDEYTRNVMPLYASPQPAQRKPLTDEEIGLMYNTHLRNGGAIQRFARAIEAAHNIKEQP